MDAATVLVRARILTAGFGCTNSDIDASNSVIDRWTGRNIPLSARTLRVGENVIKELSPIGNLRIEGRIGGLGAIVCPGDSGGPVFRPLSAPGANQQLSLVAVNSSVQSATVPHDGRYLSNLAPLSDPDFRNFLNSWIAARPGTRQICGRQLPGATAWCR